MVQTTRRAFGALSFAALAAQAHAKTSAPASPWPDAVETAARIKAGKVSASEVVAASIDKALKLQPRLNFLVASDFDRAIAKAKAGGQTGPFAGVPFLIKDLNPYAGLPTRSGSRSGGARSRRGSSTSSATSSERVSPPTRGARSRRPPRRASASSSFP